MTSRDTYQIIAIDRHFHRALRGRNAQGQVQVAVRKLLCKHGNVGSISVTGHSLGGALASLCAFDIANSDINHQVRQSVYIEKGMVSRLQGQERLVACCPNGFWVRQQVVAGDPIPCMPAVSEAAVWYYTSLSCTVFTLQLCLTGLS